MNTSTRATARFAADVIPQVRARAELVEIVQERVSLRKAGRDYRGLCPFHEDRNPSFYVSPTKQIYKCFSCGATGDVFQFLMDLDRQPFAVVVSDLAHRYGIAVRTLDPEDRAEYTRAQTKRQQLLEILDLATQYYHHALDTDDGAEARAYLEHRGLRATTIQQFRLGYAPGGWQNLTSYLVEKKRFAAELVEQAGLIVPRQGGRGYYDRFRNRLILPITDEKGQVIAFGGRALGDEQPKYLNSPESELFDKGRTLFALSQARAHLARGEAAVLVEGYFDAIALHQQGICSAVATLGTALSSEQLQLLLRFTDSKRLILNFDADPAGIQATQRAIDQVRPLIKRTGAFVGVLQLPEGKDSDEFLRTHSSDAYRQLLAAAPLWLDWQMDALFAGFDPTRAEQFQQVAQQVAQLLAGPLDLLVRTRYLQHSAEKLACGNGRLAQQFAEQLTERTRFLWRQSQQKCEPTTESCQPRPQPPNGLQRAEAQLLQVFLHHPQHRMSIRTAISDFSIQWRTTSYQRVWEAVAAADETEPLHALWGSLATLEGCAHEEVSALFWPSECDALALERPRQVVGAALAALLGMRSEERLAQLDQRIDQAEATSDWPLIASLMEERDKEAHYIRQLKSYLAFQFGAGLESP